MMEFVATVYNAPHDRRGVTPKILKRINAYAMNWRSAKRKVEKELAKALAKPEEKELEPHQLLRKRGLGVLVMEKRQEGPIPDCWEVRS